MTGLGEQIVALARLSLQDPRAGVRSLLALGVPLPARTIGLLLMAVASAFLMHLGYLVLPPTDDPLALFMMESPLRAAAVQWLVLAGSVLLIFRIGRAWSGKGSLPDTLLVVVWLQVIMLGVQVAQLVVFLIAPLLAGLVSIGGLVLFFWLLTSFIAELHGFASRGKVLAGILVASFGVAMVLVLMLSLILGPEALGNV
ncbi:YIP1 family protein [Tabrizicola piscis]|uniref:YIP1 family protein n=1 Tax=Tabrizicola piscis TaxID=2494374 RepID=A0A3S8U217_9RHOB|nr:YIP1 family protein [Tabrizicola piscis]AZL57650.1 YIP1 family protein [Tabrizicola piscis]